MRLRRVLPLLRPEIVIVLSIDRGKTTTERPSGAGGDRWQGIWVGG
jgi:hypothetical protein